MSKVVRFKPSVNLTGIGLVYICAALVQVWYWFQKLVMQHPDLVLGLLHLVIKGPSPWQRVIGLIGMAYQTFFAWIIVQLFLVGCRLVLLSRDAKVRVIQTGKQRWEGAKALGFLAVVLLVAFGMAPFMHPRPEFDAETARLVELFLIELMIFLMAVYSMFAIATYKGEFLGRK